MNRPLTYIVYIRSCEGRVPYAIVLGSRRVRNFCRSLMRNTGLSRNYDIWWECKPDMIVFSNYEKGYSPNRKIFYL